MHNVTTTLNEEEHSKFMEICRQLQKEGKIHKPTPYAGAKHIITLYMQQRLPATNQKISSPRPSPAHIDWDRTPTTRPQ